jgi:tetratricopeptide (TPR) repeat protein
VNLERDKPDIAEPSLRALARALPDEPRVQVEVGNLEILKNNHAAARAAFERVLAKNDAHTGALAGLIRLDLINKHPDAARARLSAALARTPKDPDLLLLAGRFETTVGDRDAAERHFRSALEVAPDSLDAYVKLGEIYARENRLDDARRQYEAIVAQHPNSVSAHTVVGMLHQMQENKAGAVAAYEKVLSINAKAAVAANNLAWIRLEEGGDLTAALQLAQTAKAQLPDRPEVNDTLGWIYLKKGLPALALPPLLEAVQRAPQHASYHFHLGMAYAAVGDRAKARAALERSLSLNPNFGDAAEARKVLGDLKN